MSDEDEPTMIMDDDANSGAEEPTMIMDSAAAQPEDLPEFTGMPAFEDETSASSVSPDVEMILDIPVRLSMEVGNTQISIRELLQLGQGSVIELDRLAGESLDVLVNGTLIAKGEVVVVNEKFGIRLTDIVSPSDRVKRLA